MDKDLENKLFEARKSWLSGNYPEDNAWANGRFEQACLVEAPQYTFE
jgi:hypothetical protein